MSLLSLVEHRFTPVASLVDSPMDTVLKLKSPTAQQPIGVTEGSKERVPSGLGAVVVVRHERTWWRTTRAPRSIIPRDPYFVIGLDTGNS